MAKPRFLCDYASKIIPNTWKESQILNGCASQERIAEIKSGANYCCSYSFGSLISEKASNIVSLSNDLGYSIWPRLDDLIGRSQIFRGP